MIRAFLRKDETFTPVIVETDQLSTLDRSALVWLDILFPTPDDLAAVEESLRIELPTRQESEEIEW